MTTYSDGSADVPLPLPFALEAWAINAHRVEHGLWQVSLRFRRYTQDWTTARQELYTLAGEEVLFDVVVSELDRELLGPPRAS